MHYLTSFPFILDMFLRALQDPRVWVRKGEETMKTRVTEAFEDLLTKDRL